MTTYLLAAPAASVGSHEGTHTLLPLDHAGNPAAEPRTFTTSDLAATLARIQDNDPTSRVVWEDTRTAYPPLLRAGLQVARCHDLGLSARALAPLIGSDALIGPRPPHLQERVDTQDTLFAALAPAGPDASTLAAEYRRQLAARSRATDGAPALDGRRLWLLAGLDSAGALAAAEMHHTGIPWDRSTHERMLTEALGQRVPEGQRPARLEELTNSIRVALDAPQLNPDSQPDLLRALHRAGIEATSTRKSDLEQLAHPVIADVVEYRKRARLHAANGWAWLDAWVKDGRFHPTYDVAAVVSGRWGGHGGGVQQLPKEIRSAVRADPGHTLVVADASQLEPRVLSAVSADRALAAAGDGHDLYQGIADLAFGGDRKVAKVAMLGAMYGGTTGISAQMAPRLAHAFPTATAFLESAARTGERGSVVATWLGRVSPAPREMPDDADGSRGSSPDAPARSAARAQGRFTRNFVVQGSAAEWAAAWLATLRTRLHRAVPQARQVLFLHDEIMVHTPTESVATVEQVMKEAASEASTLIFGGLPVQFPVDVGHGQDYATAKG
ncbi:MAG: bifunctional 3'-5' exonuclease/DNA polymerase [Galactobacter sp.]